MYLKQPFKYIKKRFQVLFLLSCNVLCCATALEVVCPLAAVIEPCRCESLQYWNEEDKILLNCNGLNLGDEKISRILDQFISTPGLSPFKELLLTNNNLTRIPHQIRHFTELNRVYLDYNEIGSIKKGFFNLNNPNRLSMTYNKINYIEPGAFSGIKFYITLKLC